MLNEKILNFMLDTLSKECTPTIFMKNFNMSELTNISPDNIEEYEKFYNKVYTTYYDLWYAKYYVTFDDVTNFLKSK